MGLNNLKIIPVLVIVAMLAFSVRLVDFALGVRSLSGVAMAQDNKPIDEEMMAEKAMEKPMTEDDAMESAKMQMEKEMAMKKEGLSSDEPEIDWRDASDEDFEYTAVKMEMFDDLTERREALEQRDRELKTREALLKAAEQEIERKFEELSQLRGKIENLLDKQSEEEQTRINSLVKVYEGMKPKDAARIFDTLDLDVLVSVMSRMGERKMSPILANMNPERARTVTIMLAEEKQLPALPN